MAHLSGLVGLGFFVAAVGLASSAFATNVLDPAGKTVLVVDHDIIKNGDGSKTVMTVEDDKILDANGKMVLYVSGDIIRNKPEGDVMLIIDGRHIKREVGGTNLLYVDGRNLMRGDRGGKPLYKFSDDDLTSQRRMAVLYYLMPEIFGASKEADAKLVADQAKGAAASDDESTKNFVAGNYSIDIYQATDTTSHRGAVAITKVGDVFVMDFQFKEGTPLQGVAIQDGDQVWAAVGPPATVGLAVYTVDKGNLKGTWYNATGKPESFGTENATGPDPLGGEYTITDAKAPFTGAAYTGKLTLEAAAKKFDGTIPIFMAGWDLGVYKAKGVGFLDKGKLAVATSSGAYFEIVRFKIDIKNNLLNGQLYTVDKAAGIWSLKKK